MFLRFVKSVKMNYEVDKRIYAVILSYEAGAQAGGLVVMALNMVVLINNTSFTIRMWLFGRYKKEESGVSILKWICVSCVEIPS